VLIVYTIIRSSSQSKQHKENLRSIFAYSAGRKPRLKLIPVMDMPKVLWNLLETTFRDNSLKSWNIYQERSGSVVFKLKFDCESQPCIPAQSFKRKPDKQVKRDNERITAFKARRGQPVPTAIDQQGICCGVKTRSQLRSLDIEQPRLESPTVDTPLNPNAYSFMMPEPSPVLSPLLSPVDTDSPAPLTATYTPIQALVEDSPICEEVESVLDTLDESADVARDCSESDDQSSTHSIGPACEVYVCCYGGTDTSRTTERVYHCPKCAIDICSNCYNQGAHERHRKYFIIK